MNTKLYTFSVIILSLTLTACGGGSGSGTPPLPPATATGVFVDSTVSGIQYSTATKSGITNSAGEFIYLPGETVTFFLGGIVLGSAPVGPVVTPLTLVAGASDVTNPEVTNIVRFLLTLDDDGIPGNGINILPSTLAAAAGLTADFSVDPANLATDTGVVTLLTTISAPPLVDATTAQIHFSETLSSTWGSMTWGTGTWVAASP